MHKNPNTVFTEHPPYENIILALETGVDGGSISLFRQGEEIDFWVGSGALSRSEDILDETDKLLVRSRVDRKKIGRVVFSRGPGSYTGLRIGASIAKGLSKSLECELSACGVLQALTAGETENVCAAVPFGGGQVCWRFFFGDSESDLSGETEIYVSELRLFADYLSRSAFKSNYKKLILHNSLFEKFAETDLLELVNGKVENLSVINVGGNLARFIAGMSLRDGQPSAFKNTRLIYPTKIENRHL